MTCHFQSWHERGMVPAQRFLIFILLYRCMDSVLTLVPVPHNHPVNDTVEVGIYRTQECPDGYYRVKRNYNSSGNAISKGTITAPDICKLCSACRRGERELEQCTPSQNRRCGCLDGREYYIHLSRCIPKIGVKQNWTLQDYYSWKSSISPPPTSQFQVVNVTMKVSQDVPVVNAANSGEMKSQAEHAVKPDWTDFYILTVSSTAVLFFTLSLVLLFLMAVMKARSWYLYRRLPGSGITLCFRGWLSRLLLRQRDRSTDPIQEISMTGRVVQLTDQGTTAREMEDKHEEENETCREEPVLVSSSPTEERASKREHFIDNAEVVDYLKKINAVVCCADLKLTFPQKTTYVSSCITSEADVKETRSQGNPNFILQACHDTVNVVLGHKSHKCCRNRNMLTLTSSDECALGQYEAATLEVQDWSDSRFKETPAISLSADTAETSFLIQASCKHQEDACIHTDDILNLYTEIATPFRESRDLKFNGSLQLYLKKGSSSFHPVLEKVKLRYKGRQMTEPCSDSEEREALLKPGEEEVIDSIRAQNKILKECPHSTESEESFQVNYPSLEENVEETLLPSRSEGCMQYNLSNRKESLHPCDGSEEGAGGGDRGPLIIHENIESSIPLGLNDEKDSCRVWTGDCIHDEAVDEGAVKVVVDVHDDAYCPEGEEESKSIPQKDEGDSNGESQPLNMKTDCRNMKKLLVVTSV